MKDPAFLFYTNDFDSATKFFSHEQVGKYMRLLMAQHQHGHLTEKQMMQICGTHDEDVFLKFQKDADGKFFNERLQFESEKRRDYSKSRGDNRKKKDIKIISKTYQKHIIVHMENENENENKDVNENENENKKGGVGERKKKAPTQSDVQDYFVENGFPAELGTKAFRYYNDADWKDSKGNKVKNWKQKMQGVWFKEENKSKKYSEQQFTEV